MIYLYGLFEGKRGDLETALSDSIGLQSALEISAVGPWFLVSSLHDDPEVLPKRRLMLAHTRILEKMISVGTVLPARFGLIAEQLTCTCDLINAQHELVAREFDRVRGCVELGVRIAFPRGPALEATLVEYPALAKERNSLSLAGAEAHFAIADFGGRLADRLDRRRGRAQRAILDAIVPFAQAHVLRKPDEDTEVLRAEFLIGATAQEGFLDAVVAAAEKLEFAPGCEASIQIVGPVPMYNFVNLSLALEPDKAAA